MTDNDLQSVLSRSGGVSQTGPSAAARYERNTNGCRSLSCGGDSVCLRILGVALLGVFLLGNGLTVGCAEGDQAVMPVVLTVGGVPFYLDEFEKAFWAYRLGEGAPADTSALRAFVPVYLDQALLDVVAQVDLPRLPPTVAERLEDVREMAMIRVLHRKEFGEEASRVSRQTLEKAYERLGRRLKIRYIFVRDLEHAEEIIAALRQGAAFSPLAQTYSQDEQSRDKGGELGWMDYYDLDLVTRDKVFSLPVGGLGGPYSWSGGYQIFRIDEEKPNPARGTLEAERARLESDIGTVARMDARSAYEKALLMKYRFTIDPVESAWMTAFLRERTSSLRRMGDPGLETADDIREAGSRVPWTTNPIPEGDRERVLATIAVPGGEICPLALLDQLTTRPSIGWPRFEDNRDVEDLLREIALIWVEPRDAMVQGLDKDPEVVREFGDKEREFRTNFYIRSEVRSKVRATEEDAYEYYGANLDRFRESERRRFVAVGTSSRDNAVKAAELLRTGLSVEDIRDRLAPDDDTIQIVGGQGTPLMTRGQSPALDDVLFSLLLNGVSDPIPVGQGFTVAKVLEIQPEGFQPFDEVVNSIRMEITDARADSALQVLLDERRHEFPVEIHWDAVWKARLEVPAQRGF